ncbi:CLUMA_CG014561, isoform A [Clunio marinus]|uniref:CLUMA_CG014561, isoform A n=1 Tax=Clunio marinus TaxID=568069 RepID=A0A1J1IQ50_9DIPT|nr:CLUMA_CG014561, isoform A [Clunio marinus]
MSEVFKHEAQCQNKFNHFTEISIVHIYLLHIIGLSFLFKRIHSLIPKSAARFHDLIKVQSHTLKVWLISAALEFIKFSIKTLSKINASLMLHFEDLSVINFIQVKHNSRSVNQ